MPQNIQQMLEVVQGGVRVRSISVTLALAVLARLLQQRAVRVITEICRRDGRILCDQTAFKLFLNFNEHILSII